MTPHDMTAVACARLQHWWELNGPACNPARVIRCIATELAPPATRCYLEDHLHDYCRQLWTLEGDNDDHA